MGMFNYFFIKHLLSFHYVLGARGAMVRDKMQSLLLRAIGKKHKCTSKYYRNEPPEILMEVFYKDVMCIQLCC